MPAFGVIIQETNRTVWTKGYNSGVQGGIPTSFTTIYATNYGVDIGTETNEVPSIQQALSAASALASISDLYAVELPAGKIWVGSQITIPSFVVLRGVGTNTILQSATNSAAPLIAIAGGSVDYDTLRELSVAGGATKGSTNLQLWSNTNGFGEVIQAGTMYNLSELRRPWNEHMPTWSVAGYPRVVLQPVIVHSITGTNITLTRPCDWDFTNSPTMRQVSLSLKRFAGVENLKISLTNHGTGQVGANHSVIKMSQARDCWIRGVEIDYTYNYGIYSSFIVNCEVSSNDVHDVVQGIGQSNHAGYLVEYESGGCYENNIIRNNLFPGLELKSGVLGTVFGYNLFTNCLFTDIQIHDVHSMMNLYEGNVCNALVMWDGYFGSMGPDTLFRNRIKAAVIGKRWVWGLQIVGNELEIYEEGLLYDDETQGGLNPAVFQFGYPNLGNNNFSFTNPPSAGNWPGVSFTATNVTWTNGLWVMTNAVTAATNLTGFFTNIPPGYYLQFQDPADTNYYHTGVTNLLSPVMALYQGTDSNLHLNQPVTLPTGVRVYVTEMSAFQQLQRTNKYTHTIHGNIVNTNEAGTLVWDAGIADQVIPKSLYLGDSAPSWFGTNRYPPIDTNAPYSTPIPAETRLAGGSVGGGEEGEPAPGGALGGTFIGSGQIIIK